MSRAKLGRSVVDSCADCGANDPTWASINKGILICDDCCQIHRTLGRHVSHVKSLRKGAWIPSQLAMVHALHSNGANSIWEHSLLDPTNNKSARKKPQAKDPVKPTKADFIRTKHQLLGFVNRSAVGNNKVDEKDQQDGLQEGELSASKQLHSSVRTANLETSLRLLSCGGDPSFVHQEKGTSPLHVAAGAGQASQVELLLVYGADPGAMDSSGKTPIDYANEAGYKDIAYRLLESQYELTDRISIFLCERRPDHATGQHFLIPEMADSVDTSSEAARSAKRKLQMLPNYLFEEVAMDIYDEIDRRETENYWLSLQGPSGGVQASVPFLPVNSELSATRNQARQKLGRLNAREFTTLLIDLLSEAKRRQLGNVTMRDSKWPINNNSAKGDSDEEPLYDSVASEEEFVLAEQQHILAGQAKKGFAAVAAIEPPAPGVSVEAYMGIKEQLSVSNARMQQLLASNTSMQTQIGQLQNMVQSLVQENHSLKEAQPVAMASTSSSKSLEDAVTMRNSSGSVNKTARHFSMYEPREGPKSPPPLPPPTASSPPVSPPTPISLADEVIRRTNVITRRIQEVFRNVQDKRYDQVEPCSQRIVDAVQSMASVINGGGGGGGGSGSNNEQVKSGLQQLTSSAVRLQAECRGVGSDVSSSVGDPQLTQRVIQGAYDVAKATKHLVTLFQ